MTIAYENAVEDAAATHLFRTTGLPELKWAWRFFAVAMGAITTLFTMLFWLMAGMLDRSPTPFMTFVPALMPLLLLLLLSPPVQRAVARAAVEAGSKDKNSSHHLDLGKRTVTIRPDGLFVTADVLGDTRIPWEAIGDVFVQRKHLFIRWTGGQLLTIPRRTFAGAVQEKAFLNAIAHHRTAPTALPALLSVAPTETIAPVIPAASPVVPSAPAATPANHTPWWRGQTAASLNEKTPANLNQRRG